MPGRTEQHSPLPDQLTPAARDFYAELRRLATLAGLTVRTLQKATSTPVTPGNRADFYGKSSWQRWLRGEGRYPPRKAINKLAEWLAEEQIPASHLLELWDRAFAPAEPDSQSGEESPARAEPGPLPSAADQQTELAVSWTVHAAGHLADLVAGECAAELTDKVFRGRDSLVVGWQLAEPGAGLSAQSVSAGETTDLRPLACHLRHDHWLAVLGQGGSGKTTLALLLMENLLADRSAADPVPVLLPAESLAPGEMVKNWIARTLADRYPSLRDAQAYGPDAPGDLVARRKVLPVIDGLDDLELLPRAALLGALQRALGRDQPLMVTCRPEEYHQAIAKIGRAPHDMTAIELQPVTAADAAVFLECGVAGPDGPAWHQIAAEIRSRPDGPLARALASPLMASLVRSAYTGRAQAAAALTAHADAEEIENHILDTLVFTRFHEHATSENRRPRRPVSAAEADRWLAFLATQLARERSYELNWLRLRYTFPAFGSPLRWAVLAGALAWITAGTLFGLCRGINAGISAGVLTGVRQGLDAALVVGAIYLVAPLSYPAGAVIAPWLQWLRRLTRTPLRMARAVRGYLPALQRDAARVGIWPSHDWVADAGLHVPRGGLGGGEHPRDRPLGARRRPGRGHPDAEPGRSLLRGHPAAARRRDRLRYLRADRVPAGRPADPRLPDQPADHTPADTGLRLHAPHRQPFVAVQPDDLRRDLRRRRPPGRHRTLPVCRSTASPPRPGVLPGRPALASAMMNGSAAETVPIPVGRS